MGKSKRNTPKPGNNRAEKLAERRAALAEAASVVVRPFEGLAAECDLVAMREFVPTATAPLSLRDDVARTLRNGDRAVNLATVLPGAVAALVRVENDVPTGYIAVQVQGEPADPAVGFGFSAQWATTVEPGDSLDAAPADATAPTFADIVVADVPLDITVHKDFNWWIPQGVAPDAEVAATVERANQAIMPSARLDGLNAAWWVDAGDKAHLRWVRPEDEDKLMLALARLHAAGQLHLGEGSRFAGSFRTHGLLVPVFDLDNERHATEWTAAATQLGERLDEALAVDKELTSDERRSRDGIRSRQVTLR